MTGTTQVHQVTTPSPFVSQPWKAPDIAITFVSWINFSWEISAIKIECQCHLEWKKTHLFCHRKYEPWVMSTDCWCMYSDMNIALKTDMDQACLLILLYPQNRMESWTPKNRPHFTGFLGLNAMTYPDLSPERPWDSGTQVGYLNAVWEPSSIK